MNELSQFLIESILGEAEGVDNKVVVYAGRFQPFHKGHYATYSHLVKKFFLSSSEPDDNPLRTSVPLTPPAPSGAT